MLTELYRKYMPMLLRYRIGKIRTRYIDHENYKKILSGKWDDEYKAECDYIRKKGHVVPFPYAWSENYKPEKIKVFYDENEKMPYVKVDNKKLYFPKRYPPAYIRPYMNSLLQEQDPQSPHYYFSTDDPGLENVCFVDCGAAEGFISMRMVEKAKKLILIEADQDWIDALRKSFEPWKDKVKIVPKYVGNTVSETMTTIDEMTCEENHLAIKIDVEGMEMQVLQGATEALEKEDTQAYVCTYHKPDDETEIGEIMRDKGFQVEKSKGYMFYGTSDAGFRKGMIRAYRRNTENE